MATKRKSPGGNADRSGNSRRKVRFQKPEGSEGDESDDSRLPHRRRRPAPSRRVPRNDDEEEEEEEDDGVRSRMRGGGDRGGSGAFDDDDGDDDEPEVDRMVNEVHGEEEEDEHYEKINEAGDPIEPFNLRNERDIGYFDTNGNFVWKREEQERDAWLAEMDEETMEQAIGVASARAAREEDDEEDAEAEPLASLSGLSTAELRNALIPLLQEEETVVQAIRRLGKQLKGSAASKSRRRREKAKAGAKVEDDFGATRPQTSADGVTNGTDANDASEKLGKEGGARGNGAATTGAAAAEEEDEKKRRAEFARLTDLADSLLQAGQHDVYQQTREDLEEAAAAAANQAAARAASAASYFSTSAGGVDQLLAQKQQQSEGQEATAQHGAESDVFFEYRGKDGNVHGPYGVSQMKDWVQQGYFDGEQAVMMRKIQPAGLEGAAGGSAADSGKGTAPSGGERAGVEATAPSNEDLMADLDDEEDEDVGNRQEDKATAAGAGDDEGDSGQWVLSNKIDWSSYS